MGTDDSIREYLALHRDIKRVAASVNQGLTDFQRVTKLCEGIGHTPRFHDAIRAFPRPEAQTFAALCM